MNILIVEDDENVRTFLMLLLSEQGHAVVEAANGQEGLARAREHRPGLIISDGLMPVMDGFQFLQALKADAGLSNIPFIFLSAVFTGQRELELARSLGADAFLVKPQKPAVILEAVRAATAKPPATAPGVAGGSAKLAEEYSRIVATLLEEKVRQLESTTAELERTQEDLRESEAIYRGLFENSPQPMWVYDLENLAFRAVNDAAVRKYSFSRQEFLGMTIKDIRPPEDVPALLEHLAGTHEGFDEAGTWKHRKKDGTIIDVEITSHTLPFLGRKAELVLANDVTERTRLEKAIRHASDEWRATFDAMTDAVALLDADGRILRCNKSMAALANRPFSEIIGHACEERCNCVGGQREGCPFLKSQRTLKRETVVFKQGEQWFEASADPIVDGAGTLQGAVHILQDITSRKQLEDALRESESKFRNFFESASDSVFILDMEGKFIDINRTGYERLGYTKEEMLAKRVAQLDPPEFAARVPERIAQIAKYGQAVFESAHIKRSGAIMPVEINSRIIEYEGRKAVLSVIRDITERKRSEEMLRKRELQLAESQRIAGIGSWERDLATNSVLWSKELFRIFGLDPERVAPSYEILQDLIQPEDRESQKKSVQEAIQSKKPYSSDFRIVKPDGTTAVIHSQGEVVCNEAGRPVLLRGTAQDITERKQMEDALKAAVIRTEDEKARSDSIIAAIVDGISIQDMNFRILYENEAQKKMVGDHVGELCYMAYEQKEERCEGCGVAQVFKDGGTHVVERSAPTDKGLVYAEITASPLRDSKGDIIAGIEIVHNITDRKKTENRLREQQRITENMIMGSAIATFVLDAEHKVLIWNKACEELTGVPAAEMVGTSNQWKPFYDYDRPVLADIVLGKQPERLAFLYADVSASELLPEGLHAEDWFENLNGRDRYVVFDAAPIRNSAGTVIAAIETLQDITERKKLEEQLYSSKQDWEHTFNSITDMVTVHDKDYNIILANKAAEKILGLPLLEKMKDRKCFSYYHGTDHAPEGCPSCGCLQTGASASFELFEPHLNMFIEIRAIPRFDSNGNLIGLIHVVRDITERKKAEEAIEYYNKQLTALSTASNSLMISTSLADIYQKICDIMYSVFGMKMVWLGIVDPSDATVHPVAHAGQEDGYLDSITVTWDDAPTGRGPAGNAIKTGKAVLTRVTDPEFAPWRNEAEKRGYVSIMAIPLMSTSGVCIGALTFYGGEEAFPADSVQLMQIFANQAAIAIENARLVVGLETKVFDRTRALEDTNSELQTVNRELVLRREEADAASRSKTDFLANMSHELRTPLNAIMGFSEIMLMGMAGPTTDKQREFLNDISKSGNHLLSLINDILDLSKVEAGKMELEPEPVIVGELIGGSLMMFKEKALKHAIKLDTFIEPSVADLFGDRRKLKQVLVNLLSNAFKFTPDGGSVTVAARRIEGEKVGKWEDENKNMTSQPLNLPTPTDLIEISVSDTGVGISPEHQKKLFQPFVQIDSSLSRKHTGTGLGLSLCRRFVELHGGSIRVESEPGKGSTFSFIIPVKRP